MTVRSQMMMIPVGMENFQGYFAAPDGGPFPGIVVIQEIFGINPHIRAVTERLAEAGYACLAPDLFWRAQPGFVSGYSQEEIAKAMELRGRIGNDRAVEDIRAAMQALIARPECRGMRTGVVGFCWGGLMAYLSAARLTPACAVAYYGGGIAGNLGEFPKIKTPILFHFGEKDANIPMEQVAQIRKAAEGNRLATIHTYPEAGHGFNRDLSKDHHRPSAEVAWARTVGFFRTHLP